MGVSPKEMEDVRYLFRCLDRALDEEKEAIIKADVATLTRLARLKEDLARRISQNPERPDRKLLSEIQAKALRNRRLAEAGLEAVEEALDFLKKALSEGGSYSCRGKHKNLKHPRFISRQL
ncbi:hypothetical protein [Thermosulfuriphilus sp.]